MFASSNSSINQRKLPIVILTSAVAATAISYFIYTRFFFSSTKQTSSSSSEKKVEGNPRISEIWIFPIAGCRGFCLNKPGDAWNLIDGGLEFDREFCFAVPDKNDPTLMKKVSTLPIQNEIFTRIENFSSSARTGDLVLSYKNAKTELRIPLFPSSHDDDDQKKKIDTLERYGTFGQVSDCGDEAAKWLQTEVFADLLNESLGVENDKTSHENNKLDQVRLVRSVKLRKPLDKTSHLGSGATKNDLIRFQAFGGLHLISKESVEWLQNQLPVGTTECNEVACSASSSLSLTSNSVIEPMIINAERFRANLVIENTNFPEEDRWRKCEIVSNSSSSSLSKGSIPLHFAKHTDRCEVPTMNPKTGRRHPQLQPTSTIKKLRGAKHLWQMERYEKLMNAVEEKKKNGVEVTEEELAQIKKPAVKAMFGIEMFHERSGVVHVGDDILVKEMVSEGLRFE